MIWEKRQCPVRDGVSFSTGKFIGIQLDWKEITEDRTQTIEAVRCQNEQLLVGDSDSDMLWSDISGMYEIRDYVHNLIVEVGESAINGSHGYVVLADLRENDFRWIAYFQNSNPFDYCELKEESIIARSTLGVCLRFPVDRPQDFEVLSKIVRI